MLARHLIIFDTTNKPVAKAFAQFTHKFDALPGEVGQTVFGVGIGKQSRHEQNAFAVFWRIIRELTLLEGIIVVEQRQ